VDQPTRARVFGTGLLTITAGLASMMVFLLVADVLLVPAGPLLAARRAGKPLSASGWITAGGLDPDAPTGRFVAQAVPPPLDPVQLDQVVLLAQAASGSRSSRLTVDVYETSGKGATGPGRLVSTGSAGLDDPHPGLIHVFLDPPVRAGPGHWYTFVIWTSEPGSSVLLALITGGIDTPSLWTLDDRAGARPTPGRGSWAGVPGFKLLLVMQY
jgi:hypothetical protein